MVNKLFIGTAKQIALPRRRFLFINDDVPNIYQARIFDPFVHSFNPLKGLTYKSARLMAETLYTTTPQGENTLTVRNGKRALLQALLEAPRFDKIQCDEEVKSMIDDLLVSPVLRRVLCGFDNQFSFNLNSVVLVKLDRTQLGDFDALVLALLIIGQYNGQIVIPDFGFYGRNGHASLIRENRLIAGVNFLAELPLPLRNTVLLIPDKYPQGALYQDAQTLADFALIPRDTVGFGDYLRQATRLDWEPEL